MEALQQAPACSQASLRGVRSSTTTCSCKSAFGDIFEEEAGGILIHLTKDPCQENLSEALANERCFTMLSQFKESVCRGGISKNGTVLDKLHNQIMAYPAISDRSEVH